MNCVTTCFPLAKEVRMMNLFPYLIDAIGHMIQMLPPMLLYFLCVPDEMYRHSKRRTLLSFGAVAVVVILCGSAAEMTALNHNTGIPPIFIASNVLFLEFVLLACFARFFVRVPVWPNHIIILLVFFWGTMQYNISNFFLSFHGEHGLYDGISVLVFTASTLILFPVAKRLMVPYAKEYLMSRDAKRTPAQLMVFIMAAISMVMIFLASWGQDRAGFLALALMSVCVTITHWILVRQVVVKEQQTRTELHLLASQIRPHFILNTLNAICNLVDDDPAATRQAIYDFSGYLRANYNALEKDSPVTFREELEHTRFYLSIEKLRFGDELVIETDTPVTDFKVPALTVQPMVENAVRHGLRGKEGVGHLLLKTRESDDAYEVIIRDDGIGMNPAEQATDKMQQEDTGHYGLVNVRARLKRMVGGTLLTESVPGVGTTVTIRIPKQRPAE